MIFYIRTCLKISFEHEHVVEHPYRLKAGEDRVVGFILQKKTLIINGEMRKEDDVERVNLEQRPLSLR